MQLSRYLDLYLTETQEHLRGLDRALLRIEESGEQAALEEAFRSVHTIKGMSASMGFATVADVAHQMEDRLDALRQGKLEVTRELIDELLEKNDRLSRSVDHAVAQQQSGVAEAVESDARTTATPGAPPRRRRVADAPDGSKFIVRVHFHRDAPLVAARATLAIRNAERVAPVLATDPNEPGDAFDGELTLFVGGDEPSTAALEAAIKAAGEVATVEFEALDEEKIAEARARVAAAKAGAAGVPGVVAPHERRGRFLRVELRHIDHLADGIAELAIVERGIEAARKTGATERLEELLSRAAHLVNELQSGVLAVRMVPVREMFDRFPRVVRDTARRQEKLVEFRVEGHGIELDRTILDEIADPLVHLLRNAVGHGIESPAERVAAGKPQRGVLRLVAERERSRVLIRVSDDGRGVNRSVVRRKGIERGLLAPDAPQLDDRELLRVMSTPGFSTATEVTDVSGRGVGLDVVTERVRALGGSIDLRTAPNEGTTFDIRLPLTLTIAQALRVLVGGESYVIPITHIAEAVQLKAGMSERVGGADVLRLRDDVMPLLHLGARLGAGAGTSSGAGSAAAVVIEVGERRTALGVDVLLGREQIVIKEFDTAKGTLPIFSGATLLADGTPALVLDPVSVTQGGAIHG
ncbi:MAG TPA: chemotaxis protein CheA [Longimicrobiales bacterium]